MSQNIDWPFWKAMRTVKLWQACALVVGLNPDALRQHPQSRMAGSGSGPLFDRRSFQSAEIQAKFEKALRLAENATSYEHGSIFPQGQLHRGSKGTRKVLLSEAVAFFVLYQWLQIPEALQSLASQTVPLETEQKEVRQDRRLRACIDAGLKMNKAALSRLPDGVGKLADKERVTRQSFSTDVKAALKRKLDAEKAGRNQ